jgi:hypothetical protein
MADFLTDLAELLIFNGFGTKVGKDVFLDYRPEKPDSLIALVEYSGSGQMNIDAVNRDVQVLVRDKVFEDCKSRCWQIYNLLNDPEDEGEMFTPSGRFLLVTPLQTPYRLNIDGENRGVYAFNVGFVTTRD